MKLALVLVISASALFSQCLSWSSATAARRQALSKRTFCQLGGATTEYTDEQWESDETRRKLFTSSVVAALCAALPANAMDDIENKRIGIFERASPSVVFIDTFTERRDAFSTNVLEVPLGSGSGFIWDETGHIVTNYHVVRNAQSAQIAILTADSGGGPSALQPVNNAVLPYTSMKPTSALSKSGAIRSIFKAKVVGVDPGKDIAVLKVDAPAELLTPLNLGTSADLRVGQSVLAM
jgi:S1-C subfamily serine protease